MNQSIKSVLALVILICLGTSIFGWATPGIAGVPGSQFWLRASGVLLLPAIALLVWADFRRDLAPDFLRQRVKHYFDRDGFCFAVFPSMSKGKMLRFHQGMAVGKHRKSIADTAITALSVLALHPHFSHPATIKVRLSANASSEAVGEPSQQILWRPEDVMV
jgi:hypothetical protein